MGRKDLKPAWKKGQSGNPLGGKLHNPEMRLVKTLTRAEMAKIGGLIVKGDFDALVAMKEDPKATVMQRMLCSVAMRIIMQGDMGALDILLNRLVGKVKDEDELTILFRRYETLSDEELTTIALGKAEDP